MKKLVILALLATLAACSSTGRVASVPKRPSSTGPPALAYQLPMIRELTPMNTLPLLSDSFMVNGPVVRQEMALDCEAASLQSALAAKGVNISQAAIMQMMGSDTTPPVLAGTGNVVSWGDPYETFVGNVYGSESIPTGYGVYYGPIGKVAVAQGRQVIAKDNWTATDLYNQILAGNPAVIWVQFNWARTTPRTWTAWDGRSIPYTLFDHVMELRGVDMIAKTVTVNDVYYGTIQTVSMVTFEASWQWANRMAVVVQ